MQKPQALLGHGGGDRLFLGYYPHIQQRIRDDSARRGHSAGVIVSSVPVICAPAGKPSAILRARTPGAPSVTASAGNPLLRSTAAPTSGPWASGGVKVRCAVSGPGAPATVRDERPSSRRVPGVTSPSGISAGPDKADGTVRSIVRDSCSILAPLAAAARWWGFVRRRLCPWCWPRCQGRLLLVCVDTIAPRRTIRLLLLCRLDEDRRFGGVMQVFWVLVARGLSHRRSYRPAHLTGNEEIVGHYSSST